MPTSGCNFFLRKIWFLRAHQPPILHLTAHTCLMGRARSRGMQRVGEPRVSLAWDSTHPAIMLNLPSRNWQTSVSFTPVVQSSQTHKQGIWQPGREAGEQIKTVSQAMTSQHSLQRRVTTLTGCHSRWHMEQTQNPWVLHSVSHSRAHSPKLVTGRKRGMKEVTRCVTIRVCSREAWDSPNNQHRSDSSWARPWNHRWPTDRLHERETSFWPSRPHPNPRLFIIIGHKYWS